MFQHIYGPLEGRRQDWTVNMRSAVDAQLAEVLLVDGRQYYIYGDSGYNTRAYLEILYQGAALSPEETA